MNATFACNGRLENLYLLLKVPDFVGLVQFCVEQDKGAVTQNQYPNDEEDVPAPSQDEMSSRQSRVSPFDCAPHGPLLRASLAGEGLNRA